MAETSGPPARSMSGRRRALMTARVAFRDFSRTNGPYMAAGMAYWTVFSLFPLAIAGLSIMGFIFRSPAQQRPIVDAILAVVPVSDDYLAQIVDQVAHARGTLTVVGVVGLLLSGTAVFSAIRRGVNHAWSVQEPPHFLVARAIDLIMLAGVGAVAIVVVIFSTNVLGLATLSRPPDWVADNTVVQVGVKLMAEVGATVVTIGVLAILYRYLPNTTVAWRDVWVGAIVAGIAFNAIRIGLAWYVARFSSFQIVYGSLGAIMAVLTWAYLSSLAVLYGAQLSHTYSRVFGSRVAIEPLPPEVYEPMAPGVRRGGLGGLGGLLAAVRRMLLPRR